MNMTRNEQLRWQLAIENYYDGEVVDTAATVHAPPPPDGNKDAVDEWLYEYIWSATGTGRTEGNSAYFVKVTKCTNPVFVGREFEFGI